MSRETLQKYPVPVPSLSHLTLCRKVKIQQLMVIAKVIETGSLMRAAGVLGMTQPGVTKSIHEVENFLGAPLFERSNRGVRPTELGTLVGARARSVLSELGDLAEEINAVREGTGGRVVIGTMTSASARLLPLTLARLKSKAPNLVVTVRDGNTTQLFPALAASDLDIVVSRLPDDEALPAGTVPLKHEVLYRETLRLVVGAGQHLPLPAKSTLADLVDLPWLLPLPESPARPFVERMFAQAGLALPRNRIESTSMLTNIGLLAETPCICLMPQAAAQPFVAAGLLVMLDSPAPGDFGAIGFSVRADRQVSSACHRVILELRQCAAEMQPATTTARRPRHIQKEYKTPKA
jgi:DNA-binding transcriptional LysR family regulator